MWSWSTRGKARSRPSRGNRRNQMASLRELLRAAELEGLATKEIVRAMLSADRPSGDEQDDAVLREHEGNHYPEHYDPDTRHGVKDGKLFHWGNRPVDQFLR